jgi:chromosome segregation ATPase
MVGLFDRFKKNDENEWEGGMVEERESEPEESATEYEPAEKSEPVVETPSPQMSTQTTSSASSDIGIDALMGKRVKLEEAIDYVGVMIKNLKDKRTKLEKEIEDESVDIKNLKEKLVKVREYIDEENRGITDLTSKRSQVENEADEVGNIINDLRSKLSGVDGIVNAEGEKIKNFKASRPEVE